MALITHPASPARATPPSTAAPRPSPQLTGGLALAGVFLLLTADLVVQSRAPFDLWLIEAVQRIDLPLLDALLRLIDWLTSADGAVPMWGALLVAFILARWWVPTLGLLAIPVSGVLSEVIGRYVVDRSRPSAPDVA